MNINSLPVKFFVILILLTGFAGDTCGQRKGGLLDAFSGDEDPTKDREVKTDKDKPKTDVPQKAAKPEKPGPGLVSLPPDPKALDERIEYIENLDFDNLVHVPDMEKARLRINYLRKKARQLRLRNDKETRRVVEKLNEHKKQMEDRWLKLTASLKDGKPRTTEQWAETAEGVLGCKEKFDLPTDVDHAKQADRDTGLPLPDDLTTEKDIVNEDDAELNKTDPLKPLDEKKKSEVKPPKLEDLIKAFEGQEKPDGMHPLTWARLQDKFGRELEEFRAAFSTAMKQLQEKRASEYEPVAKALKAAQDTYLNLKKLDKKPGEGLRRALIYRIYQAELQQLKLQRKDHENIEKERQGEKTDRSMSIRTEPMAPEKTLMDLSRMIEVSGTPGPPDKNTFKDLNADGLKDLYPPGTSKVVDGKLQYGNLVERNIARYQRKLQEVHQRMANAEMLVKNKEQKLLREKASQLRFQDRLNGKENHPLNEANNRMTLKKMQQELEAERQGHITQLKAKLEKEAQEYIALIEAEYKHRDQLMENLTKETD